MTSQAMHCSTTVCTDKFHNYVGNERCCDLQNRMLMRCDRLHTHASRHFQRCKEGTHAGHHWYVRFRNVRLLLVNSYVVKQALPATTHSGILSALTSALAPCTLHCQSKSPSLAKPTRSLPVTEDAVPDSSNMGSKAAMPLGPTHAPTLARPLHHLVAPCQTRQFHHRKLPRRYRGACPPRHRPLALHHPAALPRQLCARRRAAAAAVYIRRRSDPAHRRLWPRCTRSWPPGARARLRAPVSAAPPQGSLHAQSLPAEQLCGMWLVARLIESCRCARSQLPQHDVPCDTRMAE